MEIEVKFRLSDEMEANIMACCANERQKVESQLDNYFQTWAGGPALRLRKDNTDACVTLKSKFSEVNGIRTREEVEPSILPAEAGDWTRLFNLLAFPTSTVVAKVRTSIYLDGGVTLCLDNVAGVGKFIEFEIMGSPEDPTVVEQLERTIRNYGFAHEPRVAESYRELVEAAAT
jgi:predicted adenylyl cyclase CyaB